METTTQRYKRQRRQPQLYGDWEWDIRGLQKEKVAEKVWEVEDVLQKRPNGEDEEVLVKWKDWNGPNTWVGLKFNPELRQYLNQNRANPHSCTLNKVALLGTPKNLPAETDCFALRQAIFDSLAEVRYTPDGTMGRQSRVTVKLPFRREEFDNHFRTLGHGKIPTTDNGNVDCYITGEDLTRALGPDWESRCYQTSTKTFVSFKEYIHLSWGYKQRKQYSHGSCDRCHWNGEEGERPEVCTPTTNQMLGPPWIQLTFTRARRNMVTGDISKRRKTKRNN